MMSQKIFRGKGCRSLSLLCLLTFLASPVFADPITWNLAGSGGEGTFGNVRSFTAGGVTVTATAWGYTYGSSDNALQRAALGQWGTGLGVCNQAEVDCGSPDHQVDNVGPDDWILLTFSEAVDITSVIIDPWGTWDRDLNYWVGTVNTPLDLTAKTYSDFGALGFGSIQTSYGTYGTSPLTVPIVGDLVNAIVIGTKKGEFSGTNIDRFKLTSITATTVPPVPSVPEPGTLLLLGSGLAGLVSKKWWAKRQTRRADDR